MGEYARPSIISAPGRWLSILGFSISCRTLLYDVAFMMLAFFCYASDSVNIGTLGHIFTFLVVFFG